MRCRRLLFKRRLVFPEILMTEANLVAVDVLFLEAVEVQLANEGGIVVVSKVFGQEVFGKLSRTGYYKRVPHLRPANALEVLRVLVSLRRRFRSMI
jgi:hypothetical protein